MDQERKELFSVKVVAGRRTYFFDVKETSNGAKYLVISESRPADGQSHKRSRIFVFAEYASGFYDGLIKALREIGWQEK